MGTTINRVHRGRPAEKKQRCKPAKRCKPLLEVYLWDSHFPSVARQLPVAIDVESGHGCSGMVYLNLFGGPDSIAGCCGCRATSQQQLATAACNSRLHERPKFVL